MTKRHKDVYKVTVDVTLRFEVKTSANSEDEAYDNVKTDFENNPKDFVDSYKYEIKEDSYDEVDVEWQDDPW